MRILGLIPARGGSKGIPRKNIKLLNGKPLLYYTITAAKDSSEIFKLILSSDDDEIIQIAKKYNLEVPFKRPSKFAKDSTASIDVVIHALNYYENLNEKFDAVCLLQPTSPFKSGQFIDDAIRKFITNDADSLISVQKVPDKYNPHWTFLSDKSEILKIATGDDQIIARRQDLPETYHRDGIIYITKTEVIQNKKSLYGDKITFIISPPEFYTNIDTIEDWKLAEQKAKKIKIKNLN